MGRKTLGLKSIAILSLTLTVILWGAGCSTFKSKKASHNTRTASRSQSTKSKVVYYDFGDVLLPAELKVDRDNSFVFSSSGLTAGILSLAGRVEINSLITFFENKMPVDGWKRVSAIKSSRTMLLFKKQNRWCVISINDGQFNVHVEIWVAPTTGESISGLKKKN